MAKASDKPKDEKIINPEQQKNVLADFINSDDTKLEKTIHENASAASDKDGEASASLDLKDEVKLNDDLDWGEESQSEQIPDKLKDLPRKYWKHQTV